jgi:class 3 adenylate cyclase
MDDETFELVDDSLDRKTGNTGHRILIPTEGDHDWLMELDSQKAPADGHPIAFLDKRRGWVFLNLRISPDDEDGSLTRDASYRTQLVEQYVLTVAAKIGAFNLDLADQMKGDLERRRQAIVKARRERELLGLPAIRNPRNEEIARQMERLRQELLKRLSPGTATEDLRGEPELEIAHVLFMDIVGYSKLPIDQQTIVLNQLQDKVRQTREFISAQGKDRLISLPTGDGMALAFFGNPLTAIRCAIEVSKSLHDSGQILLRMGVSSGPIYRIRDINTNENVAGDGINMAQRVMDCGEAGHILVSKRVADDLLCLSGWEESLHDLGEFEVKHGKRIHIYNLYSSDFGNANSPKRRSTSPGHSSGF